MKKRALDLILEFFGVQVCCGGKIKKMIKIVTSLVSPGLGLT